MSSLQNSINFSTCRGELNDFVLGLPNLGNLLLIEELAAIPEFNELLWNTGLGSVNFTCVQTSYSDWLNMLAYRDPISLMNLLITHAQGTSETQRKTWIVNWLMENDPYQFLYTITLMNPSAIAAAQTANAPLYAASAGAPDMQQYFEQIKQSYGNSFYDQMFNHFASSSNLYVDSLKINEFHIYGSSRLGIYESNEVMAWRSAFDANNDNQLSETEYSSYSANNSGFMFANLSGFRGKIRYEMSNHLGNVLAVVSDKKLAVCSNGTFVSYAAEVISATDYSPFGAPLAGRTWQASEYRFGFNSMEKDDETYGCGNAYDFGARIYDPRLGRWLSVDPLQQKYPDYTPYNYSLNSPLKYGDPDGNWVEVKTTRYKMVDGQKVKLSFVKSIFVKADIIERQVKIHNAKLIDLTGKMKPEELVLFADKIQKDISKKWSSANSTNADKDGYVTDSKGVKIRVVTTFADNITVADAPNKIRSGDQVFAVVSSDDSRVGGSEGRAPLHGAIMFLDVNELQSKNLTPHEAGHWGGLKDIEGLNEEEWKKQSTHIMFNSEYRDDSKTTEFPDADEYRKFYKGGTTRGVQIGGENRADLRKSSN
jgi:RHS repeat-associated protein